MKTCLIKQPAGLGDIFFTQKIVKSFMDKGHKVIWPVNENFMWLNEYMDDIFVNENTEFPHKNYYGGTHPLETEDLIFIPLQEADRHHPDVKIMASKYKMMGMDYSDWLEYFTFKRNSKKEDDLFYNKLGLSDNDEYCLILRNYGSPPNFLKFPIDYVGDLKVIELDFYDNFTLFDWCKVIENASELHLIDSSINYIIDKLTLKTDKLTLYTRRPNNFSEIDYIFKTNYTFKG
jgi:hypothetical protein